MKAALLILLGLSALAIAVPGGRAQTQSSYSDPVWMTTQDVDVLVEAMEDRIEQDRLMEPPGDSARDVLRALRAQKADRPDVQRLTRNLFDRMLQKGKAAMRAKAFERSSQWLQAAREVGAIFNDPELERAESELDTTRKQYSDPYILR